MSCIKPMTLDVASSEQKDVLTAIQAKLGMLPNVYAAIAHSPKVLTALLSYQDGLSKGKLSPKEIEAIALAVGQRNRCDYCLAAHTAIAQMKKVSLDETLAFRAGGSPEVKMDALLKLTVDIVETQGRPSKAVVDAFQQVGYSQEELVEVIAWVAFNIFTNYFNHIAGTEVDFPQAPKLF